MSEQDLFRRVEELFHVLADLDEGPRAERLEQVRESDPEVYERVAKLLERDASEDGLTAAAKSIDTALADASEPLHRLGPYELIRRIGEGGMGVVYEAEQREPIQRRVAVKLTQRGLEGAQAMARFQAERQSLAMMSHPNVAQVFDAGTSPDGRPYFVMELVDGEPLHEYCDQKKLTLEARLALFLDVCAGVQHAHQKGIIHRDLKPSNILVTETEAGAPLPKIIDFGIAKAVTEHNPGETRPGQGLTRAGDAIGTLEYMSPEQTLGNPVDTRSDVYSLGIVLYELLTGQPPLSSEMLRSAGVMAAYEAIQHRTPPSPSSRLMPASERTTEVAEMRATLPSSLARRLRPDLDWVVMRSLEKEPERRYPTVSDFMSDVRRFLNHEPVQAGPPSRRYRAMRFARRHWLGVAASAALLLALLAGTVGTSMGLLRARRAEAAALEAGAEARMEAETAREVSDFLVNLFQVPDTEDAPQGAARGRQVTAEDILNRGAETIRQELVDQPLVQGRLMTTIGQVYVNLGLYDEAEAQLREALALRTGLLNPDDPDLASSHRELGVLLRNIGQVEEARAEIRQAIEILERNEAETHVELAHAYNDLGILLRPEDLQAARAAYQRARDLVSEYQVPGKSELWALDANLALIAASQGDWETARDGLELSLSEARDVLGEEHPRVATVAANLAFVQRKLGEHAGALAAQQRAFSVLEQNLGPNHPDLGAVLINLVTMHQSLGDLAAARPLGERSIELTRATLPPGHHDLTSALNNHAVTLLRLGDDAGAEALLREVTQSLEESLAAVDSEQSATDLLRSSVLLAKVVRLAGRPEAALELLDGALAHPRMERNLNTRMDAWYGRAMALAELQRPEAAEAFGSAGAFARGESSISPANRAYAEASYWSLTGELDKAIEALEEALASGYRDAAIFSERDLAPLREDPRFASVTSRVEALLRPQP